MGTNLLNRLPGASLACSACLLGLVAVLAGCATSKVAPGTPLADAPLKAGGTAFDHAADRFGADLADSFINADNPEKAEKAFYSGMTLLELQCSRYLDAVGSANQAATNERRQVGLVGGFAAALMGLTGSSAKEISGVATGFSFSGSSMDSYTTAYLFSDVGASVTKIVRDAQKTWLDAVATPDNLKGMRSADAVRLLDDYEHLCRPAKIRALIDESVAAGKVVVASTTPSSADFEVGAVLQALQAALGPLVIETQAIALYAWLTHPDQRNAGAKLSDNVAVAAQLQGRSPDELARRLAQAFLPVSLAGSPIAARWKAGVELLLTASATGKKGAGPAALEALQAPDAAAPVQAGVTRRPSVPVLMVR